MGIHSISPCGALFTLGEQCGYRQLFYVAGLELRVPVEMVDFSVSRVRRHDFLDLRVGWTIRRF